MSGWLCDNCANVFDVACPGSHRAEVLTRGCPYYQAKPAELVECPACNGQETPARFWAVYELSDKLNQKGNPYKDIVSLEAVTAPATVTSAAVGDPAILAELRAIKGLLAALLAAQGVTVPGPQEQEPAGNGHQAGDLDAAFPRYLDGAALGDNPAEVVAFEAHVKATGQPPANIEALRAWARTQPKTNGKH